MVVLLLRKARQDSYGESRGNDQVMDGEAACAYRLARFARMDSRRGRL